MMVWGIILSTCIMTCGHQSALSEKLDPLGNLASKKEGKIELEVEFRTITTK
ncbi:MAG: hypothetical protein ACI90V_005750 [Bacillariaceae sp.]|jgi:hypothetical protein